MRRETGNAEYRGFSSEAAGARLARAQRDSDAAAVGVPREGRVLKRVNSTVNEKTEMPARQCLPFTVTLYPQSLRSVARAAIPSVTSPSGKALHRIGWRLVEDAHECRPEGLGNIKISSTLRSVPRWVKAWPASSPLAHVPKVWRFARREEIPSCCTHVIAPCW